MAARRTRTKAKGTTTCGSHTSAERLLRALPLPALRRVAGSFGLSPRPGAAPDDLASALLHLGHFDPAEVVRHELRREELASVARRLGVSASGTRHQVASRLGRLLRWRPYPDSLEYARSLGLKSHLEWRAWADAGRLPPDVPRGPDRTYRGIGWTSWGEFLGTGNKAPGEVVYRPFEEARTFARGLGLASSTEWLAWCQGERPDRPIRPEDIPTNPHRTYKEEWRGMGDWLGTGRVQAQRRPYLRFTAARALARTLELRNQSEYFAWWRKAGGESLSLPGHPDRTYGSLWEGWGDFLGTGNRAPVDRAREFWPFRRARAYARRLGLTCQREWHLWLKGQLPGRPERPREIPTNPNVHYRQLGWRSWGDWLGTGNVHNAERVFWHFRRARAFVRSLGLRSQKEFTDWRVGRLEGKPARPPEVPTNPNRTYAADWVSWADWLGS